MNYETKDFQKDVIESSNNVPVLVDFWAEWCGPCKILGPILEKLAENNSGEWKLVKLNTDENQEISKKYGIRGIPNVKMFINGEVADEFTGALPEHMVKEWLKKSIPNKHSHSLKQANDLITNDKIPEAVTLLEEILEKEKDNQDAKILLAKSLLFSNTQRAVELAENIDNTPENYELAETIRIFADLFQKLNLNDQMPDSDVKDEYISAINDLQNKNFDSSLEKFINVIRNDKSYDNDGSRKACISIFKYLGEENEITLKHRRDFGSALYI